MKTTLNNINEIRATAATFPRHLIMAFYISQASYLAYPVAEIIPHVSVWQLEFHKKSFWIDFHMENEISDSASGKLLMKLKKKDWKDTNLLKCQK